MRSAQHVVIYIKYCKYILLQFFLLLLSCFVNSCWAGSFPSSLLCLCPSGHCQITHLSSAWVCCLQESGYCGREGTRGTAIQKSVKISFLTQHQNAVKKTYSYVWEKLGKLHLYFCAIHVHYNHSPLIHSRKSVYHINGVRCKQHICHLILKLFCEYEYSR